MPWGVGETLTIPQVGAGMGLAITPDGATVVAQAAALAAGRAAEAALAGVGAAAGAMVPLGARRGALEALGALGALEALGGLGALEAHMVDRSQTDNLGK